MKPTLKRSFATIGVAGLTCVIAFLVLTALGVGAGADSGPSASSAPSPPARPLTAIQAYSEQAARRSGATGAGGAPPVSELVPIAARRFNEPVARYRSYSRSQLQLMLAALSHLDGALLANRRGAARAAWRSSYADYLRLGAVYGEFGNLDKQIDGTPGGLPRGSSDPHFAGLHRLELGLWSRSPIRGLLGVSRHLSEAVHRLIGLLSGVKIAPLDYATRAHEILEDAQRDMLSGTDVPLSRDGVLAIAAGLQATEEVLATLRPLLDGRENVIELLDSDLTRLRKVLVQIRAAHGGRWPTLDELSMRQGELLDGTLGMALEGLDEVPGALETKPLPKTPELPSSR